MFPFLSRLRHRCLHCLHVSVSVSDTGVSSIVRRYLLQSPSSTVSVLTSADASLASLLVTRRLPRSPMSIIRSLPLTSGPRTSRQLHSTARPRQLDVMTRLDCPSPTDSDPWPVTVPENAQRRCVVAAIECWASRLLSPSVGGCKANLSRQKTDFHRRMTWRCQLIFTLCQAQRNSLH